jgi:Homeodomain-like domain
MRQTRQCHFDGSRSRAAARDRQRRLSPAQTCPAGADYSPFGQALAGLASRPTGRRRPAVWRWQQRYGEEGIAGLLRDKTRKPGRAPLSTGVVAKVLALTCSEPPGEATHWTGCAMAKAVGMSLRAVQRLWDAHHLQPHRLRTFKRSNDPKFAENVEDVAGLYMDPPAQCGPARSCRRRLHR